MKAVFYGFQFAHHGKHTSFLALKKEFEKKGVRVITAIRPQIFFMRGFRRFRKLWMQTQERRLYRFFNSDSDTAVHYFFPENSMFHASRWKGDNKLIMTCHQPVTEGFFDRLEWKNKPFVEGIKKADVIILMASNDIRKYEAFAPQAKVVCISHGVDTSFFSRKNMPNSTDKQKNGKQVLTVGNWLRDYRFWADVVKAVLSTRDDIAFTVIAGEEAQNKILKAFDNSLPPEVKLLSGISDEQLRDTYAESDLLFLPLSDAWANNALLEASSMSVPVMVTDLPAVREYLKDDLAVYFTNQSAKAAAEQLQNVLANEKGLIEKGKALRLRIENEFSWEKIVELHLDLYKKLEYPKWPRKFSG